MFPTPDVCTILMHKKKLNHACIYIYYLHSAIGEGSGHFEPTMVSILSGDSVFHRQYMWMGRFTRRMNPYCLIMVGILMETNHVRIKSKGSLIRVPGHRPTGECICNVMIILIPIKKKNLLEASSSSLGEITLEI